MQIAQILSGYSLGEADLLRRAMGKKKKEEMDRQKIRFIDGAKEKGVDPRKAEGIFELVAKFAGYGFNKSHAAAYAWISYQTAYLKAHHPAAFLAASMSLDLANTDKLAVFHAEAKRAGVTIHPPCVNTSNADFCARNGTVVYALGAIKNVGFEAMRLVEIEREARGPFSNLFEFAERVDCRQVGRRGIEQLARAGAFDRVHPNRAEVLAAADFLCKYSAARHEEAASVQVGLFGSGPADVPRPKLPQASEWSAIEALDEERQAIGFYLSGHPLSAYRDVLERKNIGPAGPLLDDPSSAGRSVVLAGVVRDVVNRRSKSGKPFAWITLSDESCDYEVTAFSETLARHQALLEPGSPLIVSVNLDDQNGSLRLTLENVHRLEGGGGQEKAADSLAFTVCDMNALQAIRASLRACNQDEADGTLSLVLPLTDEGVEVVVALPEEFRGGEQSRRALQLIDGVGQIARAV